VDPSFDGKGHHTQVNLMLGSLCHLHYPGIVKVSNGDTEDEVLVGTWDEYKFCRRFDPGGVPGPTSKLSPRAPAQMGRRETEHKGGKRGGRQKRGNPRPSCCPAPRSGALAVGGYKRPRGREREAYTRRPVLPRGQPSRTRALDLPFIGVRRGPRCTMGDVAVC
jgi:hypothetical protein